MQLLLKIQEPLDLKKKKGSNAFFSNIALCSCYLKLRDRQIMKQLFLMGNNTYYLMGPLKSMCMESEIWSKAFGQKYTSITVVV